MSEFLDELNVLHERNGRPELKVVSQRCGVSESVISRMFTGRTAPTWVNACLVIETPIGASSPGSVAPALSASWRLSTHSRRKWLS
jgi:hypothetical protein